MESERYERAAKIFEEAMSLPASRRPDHVKCAAGSDAELAARVCRMVAYTEHVSATQQFIPDVGIKATSTSGADLVGSMIGPFLIEQLVGEGGFGSVYRARQEQPVRRILAVKILKSGMDSRQVIARFEAERQALALMEHPGIARVIDAGQTSTALGSRPYFVMEFVTGEPITEYCNHRTLDLQSRLELFMQVCQAVQHAHQRGIIHRDLKPSNILVGDIDGVAAPKVIDFGIAKALHQPLTDAMLVTNRMELLGTPQYMSPEQADADERAIDTRTDVYSLGAVLYELLTGTTPLDEQSLRSASYSRMVELILEQRIERPSTRLTRMSDAAHEAARQRSTDLNSLRRRLHGELDWIVLKALDPDRDRRYRSAAALADDLRRSMNHQPVEAAPPSASYRLRKFVRRHRVGVVATALVVLALIGGAIGTTVGMVRARDSAHKAQDAANQALQVNQFMRDVLTSVDPDRGKGADVRFVDVLAAASTTASQRFAGHPELEAEVRELLGHVYGKLSLFPQSVQEHKQAIALAGSFLDPDDERMLRYRVNLARALVDAGRTTELPAALDGLTERIERVLGRHHDLWFVVQQFRSLEMWRLKKRAEAVEQLSQQAMEANASEEVQLRIRASLAKALSRQLENARGPTRSQLGAKLEAVSRDLIDRSARYFGPAAILTLEDRAILAEALFEQGKYQQAADMCQALLDVSKERLGDCHTVRKTAIGVLTKSLLRLGRADEAADLDLQELECNRREAPIILVASMCDALPILDRGGRWVDGERYARELVGLLNQLGGGHGPMVLEAQLATARFISLQGRLDEADQMFQALMPREDEAKDDLHVLARMHYCYGGHLVRRGLYEQAVQHLQKATEALGDVRTGTWNAVPDDLIIEFIGLYQAWGKPEKVAEYERLQLEALQMREQASLDGQ
jgi:serine/threonine protein kinase